MKNLIIGLLLTAIVLPAFAESTARGAYANLLARYDANKKISPAMYSDISLACSGEVFKLFAVEYTNAIRNVVNMGVIKQDYQDVVDEIGYHESDIEQTYRKIRADSIHSIHRVFSNFEERKLIDPIPDMNVDEYGANQYYQRLAKCNDLEFLSAVDKISPAPDGFESAVLEGEIYKVPLSENDDVFEDLIGSDNEAKPELVKVKMTVSQWLYEIKRR